MRMHAIGPFLLDEGIAAIVKLGYVTAQIFDQSEFASRMLPLVTV